MNEIKKMYENAEVKKQIPKVCSSNELYCKECEAHIENAMPYCKNADYPDFTAEKQLELIEWLIRKYKTISIEHKLNLFYINIIDIYTGMVHIEFDETIAGLINNLWQDLTEEEKQQIKGILK